MITEEDEWNFTHGACWVLANEISRQTGWQRCATAPYRDHVFVRTPLGEYLDVEGTHDECDLLDYYYDADGIEDIPDSDDLEDGAWRFGWEPEYRERAAELAPELVNACMS